MTFFTTLEDRNKTISTHTLTWSVTLASLNQLGKKSISTHTLTWSVTGNSHYYISVVHNFNSHAHVERDMTFSALTPLPLHFNSHAHVERDQADFQACAKVRDFNSHAHVERDVDKNSLVTLTKKFQLTRSRGA